MFGGRGGREGAGREIGRGQRRVKSVDGAGIVDDIVGGAPAGAVRAWVGRGFWLVEVAPGFWHWH